MKYEIKLTLPEGWETGSDSYEDESGAEVTHFEAHLYNAKDEQDDGMIDVYVGDMPDDSDAEEQANLNYADIVGFEDDEECPVAKITFNGKPAFTFSALCEDGSPMLFVSQEVKSGVLAISCCAGKDDTKLQEVALLLERNLRVSKKS